MELVRAAGAGALLVGALSVAGSLLFITFCAAGVFYLIVEALKAYYRSKD